MMKGKVFVLLSLCFAFIIYIISINVGPYKENILYYQSQLPNYKENDSESDNLITRNRAIEMAQYILKDILKVDIADGNPQMVVDVYRSSTNKDSYNWSIWWSRDDYYGNYGVEIDASKGEIISVYVNKPMEAKNSNISSEIKKERIIEISKKLTDELNIDLNDYELYVESKADYNFEGVKTPFKYCYFENESKKQGFRIIIDSRAEAIVDYRAKIMRKNTKEEKSENISSGR